MGQSQGKDKVADSSEKCLDGDLKDKVRKTYMQGGCDAMAIALAVHFETRIIAIHPVHVKADGSRRTDPDILHALIELPSGEHMDVRGIRATSEMLSDLSSVIDLITLDDDVAIEFETRSYDTASDFIEYANIDPSRSVQAYSDAQMVLGDLISIEHVELVMADLLELSSGGEQDFDPSGAFGRGF